MRVFAVDGRQTATLLDGPRAAGALTVGWDGRDGHGARVPPGVYFVQVVTPDRTQMLKIVRLD